MTAARQERKSWRGWRAVLTAAVAGSAAWLCAAPMSGAATTERVVANHHTGVAIGGYDPVAYFIDGKPQEGRAAFELRFAGAIWRFRNEGNRDAFSRNPDIYLPRYGGYDPTAVARGASAPGFPHIWLVRDKRLYLFRTPEGRDAFAKDPDGVVDIADRHWPAVLRTLTP
jgi:hypothetical protein